MLATTYTCNLAGTSSGLVKIEAEILNGFSAFFIVGLAGQSIRESKERIRAALMSLGDRVPLGRIIINLYPADLPKSGSHWDLPIALSLLAAMGRIPSKRVGQMGVIGELSLDGTCMPVPDAFALVLGLVRNGIKEVVIPAGNLETCKQIEGVKLYPVHSLAQALYFFQGQGQIDPVEGHFQAQLSQSLEGGLDYADMKGQEDVKRLMTIAGAGHHSLLLIGPPGLGKTMACDRLTTILPDLDAEEAVESASIRSMAKLPVDPKHMVRPPLRKPNYTITPAGFYGGGNPPRPGEISLAQNGVLVMDEFSLFSKAILDRLRFAMENQYIDLSRGNRIWRYPANFQLLATMNPCPCGYNQDPFHACTCSPAQVKRYLARVPNPILDRFDMVYAIQPSYDYEEEGGGKKPGKTSQDLAKEVKKAREVQAARYQGAPSPWNGALDLEADPSLLKLSPQADQAFRRLAGKRAFSRRTFFKLLKVARTIADLAASPTIEPGHVLEAWHNYQARFLYWLS